MVNYQLIADVLIYAATVQLFGKFGLRVVTASVFAVGGMFVLSVVLKIISGIQMVTFASCLTAVLQFTVALGIFYKLRESDESLGAYFGWVVAGALLLIFILPLVIPMLVAA